MIEARFAPDSPVEEGGFEPLVPARNGESFRSRSVLVCGRSDVPAGIQAATGLAPDPTRQGSRVRLALHGREPAWNSRLLRKGVRSRLFCRPKRWKMWRRREVLQRWRG